MPLNVYGPLPQHNKNIKRYKKEQQQRAELYMEETPKTLKSQCR
jgi:hypothetical protein